MGLFDNVTCHYPLPWPEVRGATWQSYDTPEQYCGLYEIREDGTLWQSVGEKWERVAFRGSLEIHVTLARIEYSALFWLPRGRVEDVDFRPAPPCPPGCPETADG